MEFKNGTITSWKDEKGFGFITPKSGGSAIFVHISNYSRRHNRPIEGLTVKYKLSKDPKGRIFATDVFPDKRHKKRTKADRQKLFSVILSGTFLCLVGTLFAIKALPAAIPGLYLILSIWTFILYKKDKYAAQTGRWRTSENTLHFFSLIGGWPGATIAQSYLRHKSKKISFKVVYWMTLIINCGVLYWLTTPEGALKLEIILNRSERQMTELFSHFNSFIS